MLHFLFHLETKQMFIRLTITCINIKLHFHFLKQIICYMYSHIKYIKCVFQIIFQSSVSMSSHTVLSNLQAESFTEGTSQ